MKLFTNIEEIVPKLPGWCSVSKAVTLASSIVALRPEIIVEIGVYGGRSLIPMAMACASVSKGIVIGIDPWEKSASVEGQPQEHATWWGNLDHEHIMKSFLAQVELLRLKNFVNVVRKRSDEVTPPKNIDIISLDGNHGPQALKDVERYAPNVRVGGLIVFDDLNWSGGNVSLATEKAKSLGFVELHRVLKGDEDWAIFQKVK